MSLTLYLGPQGSGKTYEVVRSVILPALERGRPIVTNIPGLDPEALRKRLGRDVSVTFVDDKSLTDERFYPTLKEEALNSAIVGGCVLIIDEAYTVFPKSKLTTPRMIEFVMVHRHLTGEFDGSVVGMDVVLISQGSGSINANIATTAGLVCRLRSLAALPLMAGRYRAEFYGSTIKRKDNLLRQDIRKYDPAVFKLYHSFHGGVEASVDNVNSNSGVLKRKHLIFVLLALAVVAYTAYSWLSRDNFLGSPKPKCSRSGLVVDIDRKRVLANGEWKDVKVKKTKNGDDWDLGPCLINFPERLGVS